MRSPASYKQPLVLYVLWHPKFSGGEAFANKMYRHFCSDPEKPNGRSIGIPVRFRSVQSGNGGSLPDEIPLLAEHTAIIVLVDDELVIDREWGNYVVKIWENCAKTGSTHRLYPVALTPQAFNLNSEIAEVNFIRLQDISEVGAQAKSLLNQLTHELSRLLLNIPRAIMADSQNAAGPAPVTVFLSHAKKDGLQLALKVKNYIASETQLNTFFDAHDIPPSTTWKNVLNEAAGNSLNALLVLQTDEYSAREWCRLEILQAKLGWVPSLVVNACEKQERRTFPYLGNLPSVRWPGIGDGDLLRTIISLLLYEVLSAAYFPLRVAALAKLYSIPNPLYAIPYPPELLTILQMKRYLTENSGTTFIYPDPPVGSEERSLWVEAGPEIRTITPTLLPCLTIQG
jgi:TIR domain-containing protein